MRKRGDCSIPPGVAGLGFIYKFCPELQHTPLCLPRIRLSRHASLEMNEKSATAILYLHTDKSEPSVFFLKSGIYAQFTEMVHF